MDKVFNVVVAVLLIVGGLNWGLVGVADFNLVTALFGVGTVLTKVVYIAVGVAAVVALINYFRHGQGCCNK